MKLNIIACITVALVSSYSVCMNTTPTKPTTIISKTGLKSAETKTLKEQLKATDTSTITTQNRPQSPFTQKQTTENWQPKSSGSQKCWSQKNYDRLTSILNGQVTKANNPLFKIYFKNDNFTPDLVNIAQQIETIFGKKSSPDAFKDRDARSVAQHINELIQSQSTIVNKLPLQKKHKLNTLLNLTIQRA